MYRANTQDIVLATDQYDPSKGKHIKYKFNNYGFRCDDFDHWEKHPLRVVFTGCSYSEGVGLSLENTWPKIIHKNLCDDFGLMPFWNLSAAASGLDHIVKYLYHYGDMLHPQIVICYLPNIERRERWVGDYFTANTPTPMYDKLNKTFLKEEFISYQTEKDFVMLNLLLEKLDSYMIFHPAVNDIDISYMNLLNIQQIDFNADIMYHDTKLDVARDNMHPGPRSNIEFASRLYNQIRKISKERLNVNRI